MRIIEIQPGDRTSAKKFIDFPFSLYKQTPQWVPPFMDSEWARFKYDFPLYEHSEAISFIVQDGKEKIAGRAVVFLHAPYNAYHGKNDAFIGLYECRDDDEAAAAIFEKAESWAREKGFDHLRGPKGFMSGDSNGMLIEGFEHRPAIGISYNFDYYADQWERIGGMEKQVDYISAYAEAKGFEYPERVRRIAEKVKERRGFRVPRFRTKRELQKYAPAIQEAYNSAFVDVWSYTPISDAEMKAIVNRLILIADPPLMKLIFKGDEIAGFTFTYPDISAAIQRINGKLWPFGWVQLLSEKKRTDWVNVNGNAILPKFQRSGANAVLYHELITSLIESRYQYVDIVQIQETNFHMLSDLEAIMPINPYKRHRVYQKALTGE